MALHVEGHLDDWLRFSHLGVTAARGLMLLRRFGSPGAVLCAADLANSPGISANLINKIKELRGRDVGPDRRLMEAFGVTLCALNDSEYPERLRTIDDPPPLLFVRGRLLPGDQAAVGIVGTRRASTYGRLIAERLGHDLASRGITVVSGLARGVDTAAHRGAIRCGRRTLGICGCGVDVPYPAENADLISRIVDGHGAVLSEFPLGTNPEAWHFPARNRIISALALAVVVVEAPENSGALITADFAAEHGREVLAVPGNIDTGRSRGCHRLIKDGAGLVESAEDILEALNLTAQPRLPSLAAPAERPRLSPLENRVLGTLSLVPKHIDAITRDAQLTSAQASATLLQLEIKGLARKLPGAQFVSAA